MKVKIQITETLQKIVEVDAYDAEIAEDIVMDRYNQEEIILTFKDFKDVDFEEVL